MSTQEGPLGTFEVPFPSVANVYAVFAHASELQRERGEHWYEREHHYARALADAHWRSGSPRTVAIACGVLSALSPMVGWEYAKQLALDLYRRPLRAGGTYQANIDKALRIYRGEAPGEVLRGPKTVAFYHSLLTSGQDPNVVVIDRHAAHAAVGQVLAEKDRQRLLRVTSRRSGYADAAWAYRLATRTINADFGLQLTPCQVQAVVWVTWRDQLLGETIGGES